MSKLTKLDGLVSPRGVVIIGASEREGSQGKRLLDNVAKYSSFQGELYLVNPGYQQINGMRCWPSVQALAQSQPAARIDLALVIVNASHVLAALRQCAAAGIGYAVVMTSGFGETGPEGEALEQEIAQLCQQSGLRVYGPNCPGFVNVTERLGFTFSPAFKDDLNPGSVGVATQGGGLGRNILQGLHHGDGVALWFSAGNEVDLDVPDFITHMAQDERIRVIAVLMEGVSNGRRLIEALKVARARGKPVVVLKIGRSELGVKAAQSHTGSLAGSAAVNSAAFKQYGAIEVDDLNELVAVARMLSAPRSEKAGGLCIVTFSGGTAALAADVVGAKGLSLAELGAATREKLQALLPGFASIGNPVDTTADILRDPALLSQCMQAICADPQVDTVLFPIPMDYGAITEEMARTLVAQAGSGTLIVPVWMSRRLGAGFEVLEQAGLMPFLSITDAIEAIRKSGRVRAGAAGAPSIAQPGGGSQHGLKPDDAPSARALTEVQGKQLLQEHGIHVPAGQLVGSAQEAAHAARQIGFPVVMKVVSAQILHKTEAGGVKLHIRDTAAAEQAYLDIQQAVAAYKPDAHIEGVLVEKMLPPGGREMLVGVHQDPAFGPVLTVGLGGIYVEVLKDVAHRVVPLSVEDARDVLRELKAFALLQGVRGEEGADLEALEALLLQVSAFAHDQGDALLELDLNPVWVGKRGQGVVALDALVVQKQ